MVEIKNEVYPLIDLWDVPKGKYSGKRLSTRAIMMGKFSTPMETPTAIHYQCTSLDTESPVCAVCPLQDQQERWWTLGENNSK
jgi:hypothetical protein